jgi:Spy/CpxP family protein refolding chaperone
MMKALNLTEEQQKKVKDLTYNHQQKMLDFKNSIEKNRLELKNVWTDKPLNENKILDLTSANSKIQADMKTETVKHMFSIYSLLDDQQKDIFVKKFGHMAEMGPRMREGMKNHSGAMGNRMNKMNKPQGN